MYVFFKSPTNKNVMSMLIEINGPNSQPNGQVKLLSITIDEKLKFDKHVNSICKKQQDI